MDVRVLQMIELTFSYRQATASYVIEEAAFTKLFELYPDDPSAGVPHNTGAGVPPTGFMDKTVCSPSWQIEVLLI
jgi:hypothetical protein